MLRTSLVVASFFCLSCLPAARSITEKNAHFTSFCETAVKEPSDLVLDPETGNLFIVSDNGQLFECDAKGSILRKAAEEGVDFEGIELKGNTLFVSDESTRKVYAYDKKDLSVRGNWYIPYNGGRNKGFETIVWNPAKKVFNMVTERDPVSIWDLDTNFRVIRQHTFTAAKDISGGRFYNGELYLLSDESMAVYRLDPKTYELKEKTNIGVLNPEGLEFDAKGNVIISADDLQRLYFFNGFTNGNQ
ncbi:MAG: SdiA-regulated domain-containing protein [Bacteroidota bacterium]